RGPGEKRKWSSDWSKPSPSYEKLEMRAKTADVHVRLLSVFANVDDLVDHDRAEAHFRKGEALLVELPGSELLVSLYFEWANLCLWEAQVRSGLEADALDDIRSAWTTLNGAFDLGNSGDHREAMRWFVREMSRSRNAESPFAESRLYPAQVHAYGSMGELGRVREMMSRVSNPQGFLGWAGQYALAFWAGKLEEAETLHTALIEILRHLRRAENICSFGADAAHLYRLTGRHAKAEELLREGLS